tara:strand:+ start:17200 stop:17412 length:213 start_codon:yes stop_codon:yes gene_type:complete
MTTPQIIHVLRAALGSLESGWQVVSGHAKGNQSFTIVRYDSSLTKGQMRRMHAKIEDMLAEELGPGDRVS